jgi:PAS domain S-box-containing protein
MGWVESIDKGIKDTLQPNENNYVMYIEYMDTKRIFTDEYLLHLKDIYKIKYKNIKFDLILSSDNNAYDFLRKNRDEIFGDVPVSFSGVNYFKKSDLKNLTNFTGIAETFDAKSTIEIALKLYPQATSVFIINDFLTTGKAWKKTIQEQLKGINIPIHYSEDSTVEELQEKLLHLDVNTIVLLGVYFKDKNGKYFTYERIGELISQSSDAPVFCLLEFNLRKGVVGGNVIGGYSQGVAQSIIGSKILNGTSVNDIEVMTKGPTKYIFDYNELKKYNMNLNMIPKDATILNKPVSFYEMHKTIILISIVIISILFTIIILLVLNIKKRKETEKLLQQSKKKIININANLENKIQEKTKEQTQLLSLFDKGDSVLFKWNNDEHWSVSYVSQSASRLLGYTQQELLDGDVLYAQCIDKDDLEMVIKEVEEASQSNKNYFKHTPYKLITKEGTIKWVLDYTIIVRDEDGNIIHYIGYISDITLLKKNEIFLAQQSKMASMGEMIGNIAHQWRQPLSVISTASTGIIMEKNYGILDETKLIKTCNAINDNAQYLSNTIDDFTNFIKGDRIKNKFKLSDDINSFLHLVEGSIKKHNITIVRDIQQDIKINGYENELMQCLINIFNNAKDALQENININDKKLIFISISLKKNKAIIKIKDNAGGIADDIISKIFEPYFTTKHQSQGTGLGLHITYNLIVDGMGGDIDVHNVRYKHEGENYIGAEFVMSLPL